MQGAIRVPTEKAGTGSPGENLKLVPSEKHEGEPKRLPFLVAVEHYRSVGSGSVLVPRCASCCASWLAEPAAPWGGIPEEPSAERPPSILGVSILM